MTARNLTWTYGVSIVHDGPDFVVSVRDLPEVVTSGDTLKQALELAADAIDVVMQLRMEDGDDLPPPSSLRTGERDVSPPAATVAKANFYKV